MVPREVFFKLPGRVCEQPTLDPGKLKEMLKLVAETSDIEVPVPVLEGIRGPWPEYEIDRSAAQSCVRVGNNVEDEIEIVTQASSLLDASFDS
jgi:hypothetical protein